MDSKATMYFRRAKIELEIAEILVKISTNPNLKK
jgi:hypothetical protein